MLYFILYVQTVGFIIETKHYILKTGLVPVVRLKIRLWPTQLRPISKVLLQPCDMPSSESYRILLQIYRLWADTEGFISARDRGFSVLHLVQTVSVAQPASYSVNLSYSGYQGTCGWLYSSQTMMLIIHLHLVPRLSM